MIGLDFLSLLGSVMARTQQLRRVGVLLHLREQGPESIAYIAVFLKKLGKLGWTLGSNLQVDYRWTGGDTRRIRQYAAELVALAPHVILAADTSHVGPLQQITRTVPIVFVQVADAVGGGVVESVTRPRSGGGSFLIASD